MRVSRDVKLKETFEVYTETRSKPPRCCKTACYAGTAGVADPGRAVRGSFMSRFHAPPPPHPPLLKAPLTSITCSSSLFITLSRPRNREEEPVIETNNSTGADCGSLQV